MKTADRLEGIALVVVLAHVLVLFGLTFNWRELGVSHIGRESNSSRWQSPGDFESKGGVSPHFQSPLDLPTSTLSGAPSSKPEGVTRLEIRVVKMTEDSEVNSSMKSDAANGTMGVDMSEIDTAIVAAFRHHWILPSKWEEDIRNRNVVMDVSILRDGEVKGALLVKSSGTAEIDVSALRAAERIKNIGVRLPTEFLGDRYEVRMHFHAE